MKYFILFYIKIFEKLKLIIQFIIVVQKKEYMLTGLDIKVYKFAALGSLWRNFIIQLGDVENYFCFVINYISMNSYAIIIYKKQKKSCRITKK